MSDLEARAHQLAALLSDSSFLGPERTAAAKAKFLAASRADVISDAPNTQFSFLSRPPLSRSLAACWLAAASVIAVFSAWSLYTRPRPNPTQVLAAAVRAESAVLNGPVHEKLRLSLTQQVPRAIRRRGELEIWSDSADGRFASTWRRERGALEYAVWQPDPKRKFRYDQSSNEGVAVDRIPHESGQALYSIMGGDSGYAALENRLKTWIATREWRPISLTADFSLFISQEGALLSTERKTSGTRPSIKMIATSSRPVGRITMVLEIDATTHRPRAQEIRFESAGERFAIQIAVDLFEQTDIKLLNPAVFTPSVPVAAPHQAHAQMAKRPSIEVPTASEIGNAEAEVEYELHRLHACTGESIGVVRDHNGIKISGVLEDPVRKEEVVDSLRMLQLPAWVSTEVLTIGEAASRIHSPQSSEATSKPEVATSGAILSTGLPLQGLPLDPYLMRYFSTNAASPLLVAALLKSGKASLTPHDETAELSSLLVALSQQSYRNSWAIRRLGEEFGTNKDLSEESAWLIEAMLRDHLRDLGAAIVQIQAILTPPFESNLRQGDSDSQTASDPEGATSEWASDAKDIFARADNVSVTLFRLFASGTQPDPQETVADLLLKIPALRSAIERAEALEIRGGLERQVSPHAHPAQVRTVQNSTN